MAVSTILNPRKQELRMSTFNASAPGSAAGVCKFDTIDYNKAIGSPLFSVSTDNTLGTVITILARCKASATWNGTFATAQFAGWSKNASSLGSIGGLALSQVIARATFLAGNANQIGFSDIILEPGDIIRPQNSATGSRAGTPGDYFLSFSAEIVRETLV